MSITMHTPRILMLLAGALLAAPASADLRPQGMFVLRSRALT